MLYNIHHVFHDHFMYIFQLQKNIQQSLPFIHFYIPGATLHELLWSNVAYKLLDIKILK